MARKKSESDFEFEFEDTFAPPLEDQILEEHLPVRTITVRQLVRTSDGKYLVDGDDGQFYLLSRDFGFDNTRVAVVSLDDSRLEKLYTWEKEIEAMLPDRTALVKQIRQSLYMAGAFQQGDLKKNEVIRGALRYAFPYKIEEIEE